MASIPAADAARAPRLVLGAEELAGRATRQLAAAALPGAPVLNRDGTFRGSVGLEALQRADPTAPLRNLPLDGPVVTGDDGLDDALAILAENHQPWAPVVENERLLGVISSGDVLAAYRSALAANVRRVRSFGQSGTLVEADLAAASPLAGRPVSELAWPRDCVLVSVTRGDRLIVPRGDVVLQPGDRIAVFTSPGARAQLDALLGSTAVEIPPVAE
jgi:CBS domain-containing protein